MKTQQYCAIIGDINKSRSLSQRAKVQRKFQHAIETINKEFRNEIASKFILTLGDEFQGLLKSPAESYRLVRRFQDLMEQIPFAFGIGVGTLSTEHKTTALGMDGECFHHARVALEHAKKQKVEVFYVFNHPSLDLVNALIGLMEKQWSRLTDRQKQIAQLVKQYSSQEIVARRLRVSQPAVSKVYSSGTIKQLTEAERVLYKFLRSLTEGST